MARTWRAVRLIRTSLVSGRHRLAASTALCATFLPGFASKTLAQESSGFPDTLAMPTMNAQGVVEMALFFGILSAALASAVWLIRERGKTASTNIALRAKVSGLTSRLNQLEALATAEGQAALVWDGSHQRPTLTGKLEKSSGAPDQRAAFLAFGRWLEPLSAAKLEHRITDLRDHAKPFAEVLETMSGVPIEAQGRTSGGSAVVRFANLSAERAAHARLLTEHKRTVETLETLQALLNKMPMPVWLRDKDMQTVWVNAAYGEALGNDSKAGSPAATPDLLGTQALRSIQATLTEKEIFEGDISTVVAGDRVIYHVLESTGPLGSAGLAEDRSEAEAIRSELNKTIRSHEETLDELTTAVAMFDENQRLRFYNQAFRKLWSLDTAFLEKNPDTSMFLDRLRSDGKLPEQPEWRRWKNELLAAYQAIEPAEHWWYLPDGQTIRVVANPLPKGGLTWVFENLTERIDLESRYKTLMYVQGETLDHLAEGVAVFGSDGYLELSNPAFAQFWSIGDVLKRGRVHISQIVRNVADMIDGDNPWDEFAGIVTGFEDGRTQESGRCTLNDQILAWSAVPLPNGQTMLTFLDMTTADQIERALRERNDALETTAHLKDRFIRNVSYELRSPLTNIVGFTELLRQPETGKLNDKQSAYVGHIETSSKSLMAVTDNILDLASIDAGMMELDLDDLDVGEFLQGAAKAMKARFDEASVELLTRVDPDTGTILADESRLSQVISHVLANASDFAPEGSTVTLTCERHENLKAVPGKSGIVIRVRDQGPGIPADAMGDVFERFHTAGTGRRRGAGLGLSIVKSFVALHGGHVDIKSSSGEGTEVTLSLVDKPSDLNLAAE